MTAPQALAAHVVRALTEHRGWCRRNAVPFPAEFEAALLAMLADRSGQQRPEFAEQGPSMLSYRQAAARLGVSERTVRRLVGKGELSAVRFGRSVRIPAAELEVRDGVGSDGAGRTVA